MSLSVRSEIMIFDRDEIMKKEVKDTLSIAMARCGVVFLG